VWVSGVGVQVSALTLMQPSPTKKISPETLWLDTSSDSAKILVDSCEVAKILL
jgi:hypothetical protein